MTLQWSERFLSWIGESQAAWTQDLGSGTIDVTECTALVQRPRAAADTNYTGFHHNASKKLNTEDKYRINTLPKCKITPK